jgi:hypothetical protein
VQNLSKAVSLVHGFQPWPFAVSYWRNEGLVEIQIHAPKPLAKCAYRPFKDFPLNKKAEPTMRIAARFFEEHREIGDDISNRLFLFREGGHQNTGFTVKTIVFCSILEGLVKSLYTYFNLEKEATAGDPDLAEYVKERDAVLEHLKEPKKMSVARKRIISGIESRPPLGFPQAFKAVVVKLGLSWENGMKSYFAAWTKERHPLLHGDTPNFDPELFERQKMIAEAIYVLVLKLMKCPYPSLRTIPNSFPP